MAESEFNKVHFKISNFRDSRGHGDAARRVGDAAAQEQRRQEQERRRDADRAPPLGADGRNGAQQLIDERFIGNGHQQRRRRRRR